MRLDHDLAGSGAGTEQIEALLAERLAPMPVFRLDSDTTAGKGAHAEDPRRASARPRAAILVGTQMVAKGHDFPEVTLSAILDADATLRFPDFRAGERTFAMVAQLAGRSGRGEAGGEVIVQTLAPGAASIVHAADHDSAGFLAGEVERRRPLRYPPFAHLTRIVLRCESEQKVERGGRRPRPRRSPSACPADADLLGPAPMFRVRGRYRRRLLVKADDRRGDGRRRPRGGRAPQRRRAACAASRSAVDVDPQ